MRIDSWARIPELLRVALDDLNKSKICFGE
jgi:hypothetical protein